MTKLNTLELEMINGGGPLQDIIDDVETIILERIPEFVRGVVDGWNGR